jgi:DNA-binding IscR family transcriptional regulator
MYGRGPVQIGWLAQQECIPKRFLEAILLDLRNHGLLQSQPGAGRSAAAGSYLLGIEPERINLAQVLG